MPEEEQEDLAELSDESFDDAVRPVASSMIDAWGYNREGQEIEVFFVNGKADSYSCTPDQWEEAKLAPSPGRFMHQNFL